MVDWFKKNWLITALLAIVLALAVGIVAIMVTNSEAFGTVTGLAIPAFTAAVIAFLILVLKRPSSVTKVRINLIWLSTLVAILTLVFGNKLIEILMETPGEGDTNTIEIVLSSLVGVGIGGLIAIAGQLVRDTDQDDNRSSSANSEPDADN